MEIMIENAAGSTRSGTAKDGTQWSCKMPSNAHYGYIRRAGGIVPKGADGDHVDVYLGPHIRSPHVFVVDQLDADTGKFDEGKALIGFGSEQQARACYIRAFSDGKGAARIGKITPMTIVQFKHWLAEGDTTKPFEHTAVGEAEKRSHESVGYVAVSTKPNQRCTICKH
jgi:hypothetical protein